MTDIEILSPAGDEKSFYAAINNGANAIYLGLQNFNARNKAQNFSLENLSCYVDIAHLFNVKIYVVMNTLITNEETFELLKLVEGAIHSKVDAFIVQDIGVATLLKHTFKGINLHASTQMGIHSLNGAKVAESLGFTRIVLSREVTKQDIIEIKNNTNLELEFFVHGALCVSFSGNCYLSSLCSNESGNRGRCLQPCRLKYLSNFNGKQLKNGYLFSANDLCLIDKVKELKECGITSFKIEGRLRRPSYVAYVTRMYSSACNLSYKDNSVQSKLRLENFKKLFNRGEYNTGFYLAGEPNKKVINSSYQNHRGIEIGYVKNVKPFKDIYEIMVISNGYEIKKGDGLKFIFGTNEQSLGVGSVKKNNNKNEYVIYSKTNPKISSKVYLTVDNSWEESLLKETKKIKFVAHFYAKEDTNAKLVLSVGNISVEAISKDKLEQAKNSALCKEDVLLSLKKTKDTLFELENLFCELGNVFMPKSNLNDLRRDALDKLQKALLVNYESNNLKAIEIDYSFFYNLFGGVKNTGVENSNLEDINIYGQTFSITTKEQEKFNFVGKEIESKNFDNLKLDVIKNNLTSKSCESINCVCFNEFTKVEEIANINKPNLKFVFSPINWNVENVKNTYKKIKEEFFINKLYLNLPKVLRSDDYKVVETIIKTFDKQEIGIVANNLNGVYFASVGYEVIGGVYLNITNIASILCLNSLGVKHFTKSFENFSTLEKGLTFIGAPAVMTFCHCPYKTNFDNDECKNCKFTNSLKIKAENGKTYNLRRTKMKNCVFELVDNNKLNLDKLKEVNTFIDLRT